MMSRTDYINIIKCHSWCNSYMWSLPMFLRQHEHFLSCTSELTTCHGWPRTLETASCSQSCWSLLKKVDFHIHNEISVAFQNNIREVKLLGELFYPLDETIESGRLMVSFLQETILQFGWNLHPVKADELHLPFVWRTSNCFSESGSQVISNTAVWCFVDLQVGTQSVTGRMCCQGERSSEWEWHELSTTG